MGATIDTSLQLNRRAAALCEEMVQRATELRATVSQVGSARIIDVGIKAAGGLEAGRQMARVSMAGLGEVSFAPHPLTGGPGVVVRSDLPVAACMASQYAGWEIKSDDYFAMGSGPMRAAYGDEQLFDDIGYREQSDVAVGVLETSDMPTEAICLDLAQRCSAPPHGLTLLLAPTNSLAGNIQVVARSVETTLHTLHELEFDLARIESGWGIAPLPPVAGDAVAGIGRTNDSILYGGHVVLYVRGDDETIEQLGPQIPSNSSQDHGRPFQDVFASYDYDFYKIDKHLFSPAVVELINLDTGVARRFGEFAPDVLERSFGSSG